MLRDSLLEWMPDYYTGEHTKNIQEARDVELLKTEDRVNRVYDDMYVSKAYDIELWENEYGVIPTSDDEETRRSAMLAFIRGRGGALTKSNIEAIVSAFAGDRAITSVTEYPDRFVIAITATYDSDVSFDFDTLVNSLLDLMQAHVGLELYRNLINNTYTDTYFGLAQKGGYTKAARITT